MTYKDVHARLSRERGKAAEYSCSRCGETARDWAYTNTAGDLEKVDEESGYRYAGSTEFYEPLCRSCHKKLDLKHNQEHLAWNRESMRTMSQSHRGTSEDYSRAGKARAKAQWERYWNDPEYRERRDKATAENAVKAREALMKLKSRCVTCGMESLPGAIATHQKHTKHEGVERV